MKSLYIFLFLLLCTERVFAQAPANDECVSAIALPGVKNFCSNDGQYTTIGATPSFNGSSNDIWFKLTAQAYNLFITISGAGYGGTLQSPDISLYTDCSGNQILGTAVKSGNVTTLDLTGLIIGNVYYIKVGGANTGTFKLCFKSENPIAEPGQDCITASILCSKDGLIQSKLSGPGSNPNEAIGTCLDAQPGKLNSESNSTWFKWTAANNGTLVFTLTPTYKSDGVNWDDIDWVLYDLGTTGDCSNIRAANAIRCAAGHGVSNTDCPTEPVYFKTGLEFDSNDLQEATGCGQGQDGKAKYVDMINGHVYALLVNNFTPGNNGFALDFTDQTGKTGTGEFLGPQAKIDLTINDPCTVNQNYIFKSISTNYTSLKWTFGEGASTATATGEGPYTISYSTPGIKTAVLEAIGDKGCFTVDTKTFTVGLKPAKPTVNSDKAKYCLKENMVLTTPPLQDATYTWTGPNGFTSTERVPTVPVDNYGAAGPYLLTVTVNGCTSDAASITVAIGKTPVVNFDITENNICTTTQSFTFTNRSADFQRLRWDFGADASIATAATDQPFTITYSSPGTKTITLLEEGDAGCIVTLTKTIDVPIIPPTPVIRVNKPDFCLKDTIRLSTDVLPNTTYRWSGPANFTSDQAIVNIPVNSFAVSGIYNLTISQGRCSSTVVSVTVPAVLKNPTAAFSTDPALPAKLAYPVSVKFTNQSADADTYLWNFGDGSTSTEFSPEHEYVTKGEFTVTLTAFKSDVCSASVMKGTFVIRADNTIFIPNTFSPNSDGINDEFVVTLLNLKSYNIKIFNRWGEQLFESNTLFENWKGTYKEQPLPVGTYYYLLNAVDLKGKNIKRSGSVTIIR